MLETWKNTPEKGWKVLCSFHESPKSLWYNKQWSAISKTKGIQFCKQCSEDRTLSIQINYKFRSPKKVHAIALQVSIDGFILFNFFINNLILSFFERGWQEYADENNLCSERKDINLVKDTLYKDYI